MAQNPGSSKQATAEAETPQVTIDKPEVVEADTTSMENVADCQKLMRLYDRSFTGHTVPVEKVPVSILSDPSNPIEAKIPVVLMVHCVPKNEAAKEPSYDMLNPNIKHAIEKLAGYGTNFCFHRNLTDCEVIYRFVKIENWARLRRFKSYNLLHLKSFQSKELPMDKYGYIRPASHPTERPVTVLTS